MVVAWKHAGKYMRRKNIPTSFRKGNIHGGRLWANRNECVMTNRMAGEIIERVYLSGKATLPQLKQVRHTLSYSFYLRTGKSKANWPEVGAQWQSFQLSSLPGSLKSLKAIRIPVPENLRVAYTTPWNPTGTWSLFDFVVAGLTAHDYFIFGLRPVVDMNKVKISRCHFINVNELYGTTKMIGGKSKLQGNKRGTRPWNVHRVCFCRGGKHTSVPDDIVLDIQGNPTDPPTWNTVCPLAMMEFLQTTSPVDAWMPYPKWRKNGLVSKQSHGDVSGLANKWLQSQANQAPFDRNSGRKSLSRWLEELHIPYEVGHEIHGDLQKVWRYSYQPSLPKSSYEIREQSRDSDTATKGLRLFAKWLFDKAPKPSVKRQLQDILATLD